MYRISSNLRFADAASRTGRAGWFVTWVCVLVVLLGIVASSGCGSEGDRKAKQRSRAERRRSSETANRKHVLLLTVDTLRPDYLGINGYRLPTSPFIDSLLASGIHCTHALTPIPRTTQALGSMLTGCYPHTTELRTLYDVMAPDVVSIAELAREKGYRTIAVVSNYLIPPERELNRGFDVYDFAGDIRDATKTTRAAIEQLISVSPEDSIFLWVHYIDPHVPYYPPPRLARTFDPDYRGRYRDHFGAVFGGVGDEAYPKDLGKRRAVFQNDLPDEVNAHIRKLYAADIRHTDNAIATLVNWMRNDLGNDWLIMFSSDHGESLGEHDFFYDHGDYVYNASLRIPMGFIFPPGDPLFGSGTVSEWVSLIDVMPTLIELLDFALPPDLPYAIEGRSLVPCFWGEHFPPHPLFAECGKSFFPEMIKRRVTFDVAGRFRTVVFGGWKLIWTPDLEQNQYELFSIASDPHETRNLIDGHSDEANRLIAWLKEWTELSDNRELRQPTERDLERLRSLGYIQ